MMSSLPPVPRRILQFIKAPLVEISSLPGWSWKTLVVINLLLSGICGVIAGLIPWNFYNVLSGIFFTPIISLAMLLTLTLFIFYFFQVFEKRTVSFERIFELVTFANIPFFIFQIGAYMVPPITVVALAFTGFLLVVGLTENFQLSKQRSIRLIGVLYSLVFIVWLWNKIDLMRLESL